jgi:hypothetical protein
LQHNPRCERTQRKVIISAVGSQPPLDKKSGTTAVCEGLARYAVLNVET